MRIPGCHRSSTILRSTSISWPIGATGYDGNQPWHGPPARLILLQSATPYGPWTEFHNDDWTFDAEGYHYYQPKLSCRYFQNSGRDMYLLYSATGHNDWIGPQYKINQVKMTLYVG